MVAELGHFALILALFVATLQSVIPLWGAQTGRDWARDLAAPTAVAQFLCVAFSFGALTYVYLISDFSVQNVAENSHSLKPLLYKISGVWGNHEGSLLLWVSILALFGFLVSVFGRDLPPGLKSRTLSVQAMISVGFLLFMLFTSNPFLRLFPVPLEGNDLNPLLQDPGLAIHPPFLYLGYVGCSISFSFAVAALIEGKVDAAWARWVRPWTLLAWTFLTAGIALGSWWAYYELGWGGFWYWDPVENASFMPWLSATALLHSAIVVEKRDTLKSWTILLAIVTFSLSLIGTFLVRSGVLNSVHAFANDPERGVFILLLLVVAIGGSFALYAWRAPDMKGGGMFRPISREGALVLNNLLLSAAAATVFLGTLYPLFLEVAGGDKVSVGPPYFNATFVPLMIPLLIALGIGPFLSWKRGDLFGVIQRMRFVFLITVVVSILAGVAVWGRDAYALVGLAVATWLALATIAEMMKRAGWPKAGLTGTWRRLWKLPRAAWGMSIAHLGVALIVAGATGASMLTLEVVNSTRQGDVIEIADYEITFEGVREVQGPNYAAVQGVYTARKDDKTIWQLFPEKRRYFATGRETTEAAIESNLWSDLYVVISGDGTNGAYVTRVYHKPLVPWLWLGCALLIVGGFMSLSDRRLRVGAPKRSQAKGNMMSPSPTQAAE
ncbi:heme lyase CcmF/NrfE family subunit [Curvivirga aplysinae]|uniref:heme lyase CcmF/NrfE family subunit n=1 Tax=Curvivirga aplysinae TaxID=2529852 RepID=UPI0012BCBFE4|nr:heme lyase CcmF/NrfE family subunit [Curvivirga aplysinae]MTI08505.1 heme lyase CcmF/NrfE family subunit [Curvivirga aplysinae]